jgi:VWFA-related protein
MLPVSVTDRLGRYIPDLQRRDFHIYEEGTEQEIAYFAAVDKPFTVVLMIDTSPSDWPKLNQIRAASKAFVDQLRPEDQVMVVSFARGLTIECEATTDRQKIRRGIDKSSKGLSTKLYDAMDAMMLKHLGRIKGRKAIVLFTDGVDAISKHATYESTLREAEELDALIYPIRYDTYDPSKDDGGGASSGGISILGIRIGGSGSAAGTTREDYEVGERYLNELARLTSGRAYEASRDLSYLQNAFSHIAEELRRQYSLGYYPKQTAQSGERRHLKVRVERPDLAVRTRDSYVFKGASEATVTPAPKSSSPPVLKKPLISER